jgi:hypothetical protein
MNEVRLNKKDVIEFFGGSQMLVADALGIKQSSVSCWEDILSVAISDRVRGAAIRMGKKIPKSWMGPTNETAA